MFMEVSSEHPPKAQLPISITEFGIITYFSPEQPMKAPSPISVTELGIVAEISAKQNSNAQPPTVVTEYDSPLKQMLCGITIEPVYLSLLLCVASAVLLSWFSR